MARWMRRWTGLAMSASSPGGARPKKPCCDCRKVLSPSAFRRDVKNEDGLRRRCKACDARRADQRRAEVAIAACLPCATSFALRIFSAKALVADLAADRRVPMSAWNKSLPLPSVRFGPVPDGAIHEDFADHYARRRGQRYGWIARDHAHDVEAARPAGTPVPRPLRRDRAVRTAQVDAADPCADPLGAGLLAAGSLDPAGPPAGSSVGDGSTVVGSRGAGGGMAGARSRRSAASREVERARHEEFAAREALRLERKVPLVRAYAASFPSFDDLFEEARAEALAAGRDAWVLHGIAWRAIPYLPRLVRGGSAVLMFQAEVPSGDARRGTYVVAAPVIGLVSR